MLYAIFNPNWSNMSNVYVVAETANYYSDGWIFGGFILALFFVMMFTLQRYSFIKALATSGWICFLISAVSAYGNLLSLFYPLLFLALCIFSVIVIIVKKE